MANIISAIINLVNNPVHQIKTVYTSNNRANSVGDALEEYIKDLFAGTVDVEDESERLKKISETFSYTGNSSNPPDAMLFGGDAIEVKKIEKSNSALALNSSYPKQKLFSSSSMISNSCKNSEVWTEKDMIYTVGVVNRNNLRYLCMVYGLDYCAEIVTYERIKSAIKKGIEEIPNIQLSPTNELGKLQKIDPLGITYLRIRGMWGIENPWKVFQYVYERPTEGELDFMCIINDKKWSQLENVTELLSLEQSDDRLSVTDVMIKNPDNPAQLRSAKLITFSL